MRAGALPTATPESAYSRIDSRMLHDWSEADLQRVLGGDAAALYGFDLDALAPAAARLGPLVADIATPLSELPAEPNEALLRNVDAA